MPGSNNIKNLVNGIADFILNHTRIIMPVILIACVSVTVVIAINARGRAGAESGNLPQAEDVAAENELPGSISLPELPLELNAYPEVNDLIQEYYRALASGDLEVARAIRIDLDELAIIRIEEMAKYIDYYDKVDVYTKAGVTENSYVAYVSSAVKFTEIDALMPGIQSFYILPDETGRLVIKKSQLAENIYNYIDQISLAHDVIDLYNKITVEYNDLLASDKELEEFIAYMTAKINENVGVVLAQMEQPDITAEQIRNELESGESEQSGADEQPVVTSVMLARAMAVVNIRSSDSETADRLDKAIVGQEFTVLEQKGNGWSRVKYGDRDAYIKSEFLEILGEVGGQPESAAAAVASGKIKAKESVRVRAAPSTSATVLGTLHVGEILEMIEQTGDGWTKVKYNNQIGYVKAEFVEKQ